MNKIISIITALILSSSTFDADAYRLIDASTNAPLPLASITDCSGNVVGMTDKSGVIPELQKDRYPITFNYMGYASLQILKPAEDDVKMIQQDYELPEIVISPGARPLLHLTGYMREITSVLSSSDSVTIFKESVVDFLVPVEKTKAKGWKKARELASKTYVRMSDAAGLDSVSTSHEYEFMLWGYRKGLIPSSAKIPDKIKDTNVACDTIMGKYYPKIIWLKNGDVTRWYGDALANEKNHITTPWALKLFGLTTDVTEISENYVFDTPDGGFIRPTDLRQVSVTIDMLAKGTLFKKTFDSSSPVNVRTYMELYLTDREFLSVEEGKSLKNEIPSIESSDILAPANANPLHPAIMRTVERVNSL